MVFVVKSAAASTDWVAVGAWAAWASVAIYIILGIFAWIQVLQARRLREAQARPFVIVDFEPGFLVYLTVKNIGNTLARNVMIKFDKELESSLSGVREIDVTPIFRRPISSLPPGKSFQVLFDSFEGRVSAGLPLTYDVSVTYQGPVKYGKYNDKYTLDLETYKGAQLPRMGIPELVAEIKGLREEIQKWRGNEPNGIVTRNIDQNKEETALRRKGYMYILYRNGLRELVRSVWKENRARHWFLWRPF